MFCSSVQFVLLNLLASSTCVWAGAPPQMTLSEFELCLNYIYVFSPPWFFGILYYPSIVWHQWIISKFNTIHTKKLSRCSFCGAILPGSVYLVVLIKNYTQKVIFSYSATLTRFKTVFTGMGWDPYKAFHLCEAKLEGCFPPMGCWFVWFGGGIIGGGFPSGYSFDDKKIKINCFNWDITPQAPNM